MSQACAPRTKIGSSPLVQTREQSQSRELAGLTSQHNFGKVLDDFACFSSERTCTSKQHLICRQD